MSRRRAAAGLRRVGERLGMTMRFTDPAVIAANRRGCLTPEQINLIARYMHPPARGCALIMVPGLLLLLIGGTYITLALQGQLPTSPRAYVVALGLAVLIVIGVLKSIDTNTSRARAQRRQEGGDVPRIDHAEGAIVWSQKEECYCLRVPGHDALAFPAFVGELFRVSLTSYLRPGPNRFYYVNDPEKRSEVMVSAEPIRVSSTDDEQARMAVQQGLCVALDFSRAELAANQQQRDRSECNQDHGAQS